MNDFDLTKYFRRFFGSILKLDERKRALKNFEHILTKLEAFIRKYYTKILLKGVLMFVTLSLLLFLVVTGMEYALWLSPSWRLALFFSFLLVLSVLGYRYVVIPLAYLTKIRKGIAEKDASKLIGRHFPQIGDKLVNLLELSENPTKTDLLLASIEQRSKDLQSFSFADAIDLRDGLRYLRYLFFPIAAILVIWISGSIADFFGSYGRVVNYDVAYEKPAPFRFLLQNQELKVLEDQPLIIGVQTLGEVLPESVAIETGGGERMVMKNKDRNNYEIRIEAPIQNFSFRFVANDVKSREYDVKVINVPAIVDFGMELIYPSYLKLNNKTVKGTGNVTIPEGTRVNWTIKGQKATNIDFVVEDTIQSFDRMDDRFVISKEVYNSFAYEVTTSNLEVRDYERLGYRLNVIKDAMPIIQIEQTKDSLRPNESYFSGGVSDDHGIDMVSLVYYETDNEDVKRKLEILWPDNTVAQFYYTFPSGLIVDDGKAYEMYFEVTDNDALRGGKTVKSEIFRTKLLGNKELKDKRLQDQELLIKELNEGLRDLDKQNEELREINKEQKQGRDIEFKEKERIRQFLNKQKQQEALMQKFSNELKNNLQKEDARNELNDMLKERLERQEQEAKKNQKLLEELEKVADKIEKEELKKRLEDLAKSQKSGKRNLEQLLELTKRYYVTEKASQLAQKLDVLSKKQEVLSKLKIGQDFSGEEQEKLNQEFNKISEELDELKGDNRALRKPMNLEYNKNEQDSIKRDQEDALEEINKYQGGEESSTNESNRKQAQSRSTRKQKSAAQKMKELSEKLQQSTSGAGGSSGITEDAEMLRQILDNLISFSFRQEGLFEKVSKTDIEINEFSTTIRNQKELRQLFEHVDDSLFALSLRRAELSEFVNKQIEEVYYNVDKSLESIADNQIYQAAAYQQYVLNASNALADFLANTLDNMQQSMKSGQGEGQGSGFQLPDIIKEQKGLRDKMQQGAEPGSEGQEDQKQPNSGNEGEGQDAEEGNGKESSQGEQGKQGEGEGEGEKEGNKGGKKGNGKEQSKGSTNQGMSEAELNEIYEIYQEQQILRNALEEQLKNIIDLDKRDLAKKLTLQMEQFENELLENGITKRTLDQINRIEHQLLKLENAALKQGKKRERESESNLKDFSNPILTKPELFKSRFNEIEILNRQALPLRPDYQIRVKKYFDNGHQF